MCTLAIAWQVFDGVPVVVAANRDEATDRPSEPPATWGSSPEIVAPRDAEAGGTWIGYNETGLFVGIANRWTATELAAERSRGLLVADALGYERAESAVAAVQAAVEGDEYAGFNLLLADAEDALLLRWDGELEAVTLEPGLHVVTNAGYDDRFEEPDGRVEPARGQAETARGVRAALEPRDGETADEWLDRAASVLGDHDLGVCVHGGVSERRSDGQPGAEASGGGYGTRSSSLIALHDDGRATFRYADGPPCETTFHPVEGQS